MTSLSSLWNQRGEEPSELRPLVASLQNKDNDVVLQISKMESRLKNLKGRPTWSPGLLSPLVLCICCSLCLECSSPRSLQGSGPQSFSPLPKCHPLGEVFFQHPTQNSTPRPHHHHSLAPLPALFFLVLLITSVILHINCFVCYQCSLITY